MALWLLPLEAREAAIAALEKRLEPLDPRSSRERVAHIKKLEALPYGVRIAVREAWPEILGTGPLLEIAAAHVTASWRREAAWRGEDIIETMPAPTREQIAAILELPPAARIAAARAWRASKPTRGGQYTWRKHAWRPKGQELATMRALEPAARAAGLAKWALMGMTEEQKRGFSTLPNGEISRFIEKFAILNFTRGRFRAWATMIAAKMTEEIGKRV